MLLIVALFTLPHISISIFYFDSFSLFFFSSLFIYMQTRCHRRSGTGKTSTIVAIARQLYGASYKSMTLTLNASDDR